MVELARFIDLGEDPENGLSPPKTIDWEQDRTVIVSEINKAAGLELRSLPFLHWWTFMGYFGAIGEGQLSTVVDFGKEAVQIGSDVAEVQNVVDTAFGELRDQAEEFASTSITRFGMSALSAKKTASTYMAMARGMGVANQTRILSMQWQEFMGILGQSIITVLKPVVKWLNAVVSHMIALATLLNNTVTKAFGGESKQAEATSSAIASSVDNQEALTGAVKDTSKAQQKSLAGFDEITKLAGEAAESAGGGVVSEIDWYAFGMLLFKRIKIGLETLAGFLLGLDMPQLAQAAS